MPPILIALIIIAVVVLILVIASIKIVRQSTSVVIERLGKFHRLLNTGVHFIIPFICAVSLNALGIETRHGT